VWHENLAVVAEKTDRCYVVDRGNMGAVQRDCETTCTRHSPATGTDNFSSPIYFNGRLYKHRPVGNFPCGLLYHYPGETQRLAPHITKTAFYLSESNGTVPSASANGTANGIVWALDRESRNFSLRMTLRT